MNITLVRTLRVGTLLMLLFFSNAISLDAQQKITIRPANSFSPVDFSGCTAESLANFQIKVKEPNGDPAQNVDVKIRVAGIHGTFKILSTNDQGIVNFNYTGFETGVDRIMCWTDQTPGRAKATKTWVPCPYADEDCDGIINMDDLCDGGDDTIDNNNDNQPDCAIYPSWQDIEASWKCGADRVLACLPVRFQNDPITVCIKNTFLDRLLKIGGFLGPCDGSTCTEEGFAIDNVNYMDAIAEINQSTPYYITEEGDFYEKSDPEYSNLEEKKDLEKVQLAISPNPASDFITLELSNLKDSNPIVSIIDITGKQIFKTNLINISNNRISLTDQNIDQGVYVLQVIHTEGILSEQFIVSEK